MCSYSICLNIKILLSVITGVNARLWLNADDRNYFSRMMFYEFLLIFR